MNKSFLDNNPKKEVKEVKEVVEEVEEVKEIKDVSWQTEIVNINLSLLDIKIMVNIILLYLKQGEIGGDDLVPLGNLYNKLKKYYRKI